MFLDQNYVAAIIKLLAYNDVYLYIARLLDPRVLAQLRATQASVAQYADLSARQIGIQIAFGLMYTVIALIVLLSAVWIGLNFANYLVAPIRRLIGAAQVVSTGNLYVQVPTRRSEGDLAQLGETFNKMTQELRTQRDDIVRARDLIDSRRRFTEAVLAGASAGVIGVDGEGAITILQRSAERLRRKYAAVIKDDGGIFQQCTDTIVRQVDDIKRMVDEFSRFARMPKPVMAADDVADTVRQVVFLQRVGNADIDIDVEIAQDPMPARFDRRLVSQALTNIIKNATEAVTAVPPDALGRGRIRVFAGREGSDIVIDVV